MSNLFRTTVACVVLVIFSLIACMAYDTPTHQALSLCAITSPHASVNDYLQGQLLLDTGIDTLYQGKTLAEWIGEGAIREDDNTRSRNHFYDPISKLGLHDLFSGTSSWIWASSDPGNEYNWQHAREYYYKWLTEPDAATREQMAAKTFRSLGQIIHLVQDLAQPQHTRNDAHQPWYLFGHGAPYEEYCAQHYGSTTQIPALWLDEPVPQFTSLQAFWDSGQYRGQDPSTLNIFSLGLAEYSNAFFVTDSTMFTGDGVVSQLITNPLTGQQFRVQLQGNTEARHFFPYPRINNTSINTLFVPTGQLITLNRAGESIKQHQAYPTKSLIHPSIASLFSLDLSLGNTQGRIGLNDANWQSDAEHLLPKAISYSTGVLNYFFRSTIDVVQQWDANLQKNILVITNTSSETISGGTWELYLDDAKNNRMPVNLDSSKYPGSLAPGQSFNATFDEQFCGDAYTLVFHGTIGQEQDTAVAAKRFTGIPETWEGTYFVPEDPDECLGETGAMTIRFSRFSGGQLVATVHWVSPLRNQTVSDIPSLYSGSQVTIGGPGGKIHGIFLDISGASASGYEIWQCPTDGDIYDGDVELTRTQ